MTSLNVVIAALVTGSVTLWRFAAQPLASIVLFVFTMVGGIVGSFALSDWHLGSSNGQVIGTAFPHLRGIGIWMIAALVMLISLWLIRFRARADVSEIKPVGNGSHCGGLPDKADGVAANP